MIQNLGPVNGIPNVLNLGHYDPNTWFRPRNSDLNLFFFTQSLGLEPTWPSNWIQIQDTTLLQPMVPKFSCQICFTVDMMCTAKYHLRIPAIHQNLLIHSSLKFSRQWYVIMPRVLPDVPQIFEWRSSYKDIEQNVKDSCFWASCIAGILKNKNEFQQLKKLMAAIKELLTQIQWLLAKSRQKYHLKIKKKIKINCSN